MMDLIFSRVSAGVFILCVFISEQIKSGSAFGETSLLTLPRDRLRTGAILRGLFVPHRPAQYRARTSLALRAFLLTDRLDGLIN